MIQSIDDKIYTIESLSESINSIKEKGEKVVFTNGCYDIIHPGHVRYLLEARKAGDYLIVAVNSDESVKTLKGDKRPINCLSERMTVLAGLYFVDFSFRWFSHTIAIEDEVVCIDSLVSL